MKQYYFVMKHQLELTTDFSLEGTRIISFENKPSNSFCTMSSQGLYIAKLFPI